MKNNLNLLPKYVSKHSDTFVAVQWNLTASILKTKERQQIYTEL